MARAGASLAACSRTRQSCAPNPGRVAGDSVINSCCRGGSHCTYGSSCDHRLLHTGRPYAPAPQIAPPWRRVSPARQAAVTAEPVAPARGLVQASIITAAALDAANDLATAAASVRRLGQLSSGMWRALGRELATAAERLDRQAQEHLDDLERQSGVLQVDPEATRETRLLPIVAPNPLAVDIAIDLVAAGYEEDLEAIWADNPVGILIPRHVDVALPALLAWVAEGTDAAALSAFARWAMQDAANRRQRGVRGMAACVRVAEPRLRVKGIERVFFLRETEGHVIALSDSAEGGRALLRLPRSGEGGMAGRGPRAVRCWPPTWPEPIATWSSRSTWSRSRKRSPRRPRRAQSGWNRSDTCRLAADRGEGARPRSWTVCVRLPTRSPGTSAGWRPASAPIPRRWRGPRPSA